MSKTQSVKGHPKARYITQRVGPEVAVIDTEADEEVARWGHPNGGLPLVKEDFIRILFSLLEEGNSAVDCLGLIDDIPEEIALSWVLEAKDLLARGVKIKDISEEEVKA